MTVWGISRVKDEADCIEGSVRHMAGEVDRLLVADNGSTDGTRDILSDLAHELPLMVVDDNEAAYYQSRAMSALAAQAGELGASWIVPWDADEIWFTHWNKTLADFLRSRSSTLGVAAALLFNHLSTAIDDPDPDPFRRMAWRQAEPVRLPKVAFRWEPGAIIHQGNHGVTLPNTLLGTETLLEVRHFPMRSPQQMLSKVVNGAAAYKATDLPESEGAHWRSYGRIHDTFGDQGIFDVFNEHWHYLSPVDAGLLHDPAPYLQFS